MKRLISMALACAAIMAGGALSASAQTHKPVVHFTGQVYDIAVCGDAMPAIGTVRCNAHVVTDAAGAPITAGSPATIGGALTPTNLHAAYNIPGQGSSATTIAIVDAYGYNNAEADLAVYRTTFGLPPCTTANGCFKKVNQNGVQGNYPAQNTGWADETALDLDMASAMCPNCKIILVEANDSGLSALGTAVNTAVRLGATVVSNSYGGPEAGSQGFESAYNHPGVAITASSGDGGYGVLFPASSPHVIAVGGTTLVRNTNVARGWSETAWAGAGSGCSTIYAKPVWQKDPLCTMRMEADVSAVANPATGVAVYGPTITGYRAVWQQYGGTSVAAPVVAGIIAVQGGATPNYAGGIYSAWKASPTVLNDVIKGSNGSCGGTYFCTAGPGYDGPTGLGTPNGISPF